MATPDDFISILRQHGKGSRFVLWIEHLHAGKLVRYFALLEGKTAAGKQLILDGKPTYPRRIEQWGIAAVTTPGKERTSDGIIFPAEPGLCYGRGELLTLAELKRKATQIATDLERGRHQSKM